MFARRNSSNLALRVSVRTRVLFSTLSATYEDVLNRLNSLQSGPRHERSGPKLDSSALSATRRWVEQIGYHPSDFHRLHVVHVAGTKGKGTTCAYVDSILSSYKKTTGIPGKIGLYTSPHLTTVRDRIQIDSKPISKELFTKYFLYVWNALGCSSSKEQSRGPNPSYFRFLTLLSLHVFMSENVDVAIYEVGVGGAWDSTNIIEKPSAVGIARLGIDHTSTLGHSIGEIAWHKAGIFKPGCLAFSVPQVPGAMRVLEREALNKEVHLQVVNVSEALCNVKIRPDEYYQKTNASLAVALATTVLRDFNLVVESNSGHLPPEVINGLEQGLLRGRTEIVEDGNKTWYFDGAHTEDSMKIACRWYANETGSKDNRRSRVLIFNQQSQRDATLLLNTLYDAVCETYKIQFQHVIFCTNATYEGLQYKLDLKNRNVDMGALSSLSVQKDFAKHWVGLDQHAMVHVRGSIQEAVELVTTCADIEDEIEIFVTGSLHLVGGLISILEEGIPHGLNHVAPQ